MRIGPVELRRARAATVEPRAIPETGASGVVNLQGFLQELEYSNDLRGRSRFTNLETMRSSDGAVQEAIGHITAPIRDATWDVEPASTQEHDLEVAAAVRAAFMDWMCQPFAEYLDQALDYLVFGHQVFEIADHVVEKPLTVCIPGQDDRILPAKQWLTFRRFAQRLPATIWRWNVDDNEDLVSVVQQAWKDDGYHTLEMPAEQLLVFVNQKRGADWTGRSILRSAYKHWVMKELVEKIEVVALERLGVGVLVGYPSNSSANDTTVLDRMEDILRDIRAGANTYIVSPGPKGQSSAAGQDGFLFEILTPGGSPPDFKSAKEYHRGEIKGAMLVRFSELGHGTTGARSTGDTQSKVWLSSLSAVARHIGEVNQKAICRFVDANYRNVTDYPRLVAHDIDPGSLEEFANTHFRLVTAGAIRPDDAYYRFVRESVGAPPEEDSAALDLEEQQKQDALLNDGPHVNPPGTPMPPQQGPAHQPPPPPTSQQGASS